VKEELTRQFIKEHERGNGLFDGVFLPLKMLGQDKKGMGATLSTRMLKGAIATADDNFVQTAERAGFIPFGKTNAPEFGFKNITDSTLYGDTKNVWNTDYYPGGSSGGAASCVASGMFPIASGGDGGGSIRIPASWSGLIGLKATRGRMPQGPTGFRGWQGAAVEGSVTVSVRDTANFLAEMQVVQHEAPYQTPLLDREKLLNLTQPQRKLKIAFSVESPVGTPITEEAKVAVRKAVKFLEAQGHVVEEVPYPMDTTPLIETYYQMNAAETLAMLTAIEQGSGIKPTKDNIELMTYALLEYGKTITAAEYIKSLNDWDFANVQFTEKIFNQYDFFLTPTTATQAPRRDQEMIAQSVQEKMAHMEEFSAAEQKEIVFDMFQDSLALSPYPFIVNLTGQTAITLPIHVAENGLPQGVQFMAQKGGEIALLQLAKQFEDEEQFILPSYYQSGEGAL
jgi:amidase